MPIDLIGGVVLLVVFVLGTMTRANIGALGLVASFAVGGLVLGEGPAEVMAGFPATTFLLFLGVTYLFSVAVANGTMDWIIGSASRLVRGRATAVPIGLFAAGGVMSSSGVPTPAVVAMLSPVGIRLGRTYRIPILVTVIVMLMGASGGTFSPISLNANVARQSATAAGIPPEPLLLYVLCFGFTTALAAVMLLGWRAYDRRGREPVPRVPAGAMTASSGGVTVADRDGSTGGTGVRTAGGDAPAVGSTAHTADPGAGSDDAAFPTRRPLDLAVASTLLGFVVVVAGALIWQLDLGILALSVALVLHLAFPRDKATAGISWDVILLICGLMTYIAVLERAGTVRRVGEALVGLDAPVFSALVLCMGAALVSAFASSPATIGTTIPLAAPLMLDGSLPAIGVLAAICLCATLVDASPFSAVGALTVAGAPADEARGLFRKLTAWGLSMIIVAPLLTVGVLVALPLAFG